MAKFDSIWLAVVAAGALAALPGHAAAECTRIVTDAVKCGTTPIACTDKEAQCAGDVVFEAARCGASYAANASLCGTQTTTSGELCGFETITDAEKCGRERITDAEKCGRERITDAAKCGVTVITDVAEKLAKCAEKCVKDPVHCTCEVAKSCEKGPPKSCTKGAPKSCEKGPPKSCEQPRSCCSFQPASCAQAKQCWKPKSCSQVVACATSVHAEYFVYTDVPGTRVTVSCTGSKDVAFGAETKIRKGACNLVAGDRRPAIQVSVTDADNKVVWRGGTEVDPAFQSSADDYTREFSNNTFGTLTKSGPVITGTHAVSWGFFGGGPLGFQTDATDDMRVYVYVTRNQEHWMRDLAARQTGARNAKLRRWVLPGSHDSGMFTTPGTPGGLVDGLSVTQKNDAATQLRLGARYFDFRPGENMATGGGLYAQHALIQGGRYEDFVRQVVSFLDDHPGEIVLVELGDYGFVKGIRAPSNAELLAPFQQAAKASKTGLRVTIADQSIETIRPPGTVDTITAAGPAPAAGPVPMAPTMMPFDQTYADLLASNRRLLITIKPSKEFMPGSYTDGAYLGDGSKILDQLRETLRGCVKPKKHEGRSTTMLQLQSTTQGQPRNIARTALLSYASPLLGAKPLMDIRHYTWVSELKPEETCGSGMIMINDFYDNLLSGLAAKVTAARTAP